MPTPMQKCAIILEVPVEWKDLSPFAIEERLRKNFHLMPFIAGEIHECLVHPHRVTIEALSQRLTTGEPRPAL